MKLAKVALPALAIILLFPIIGRSEISKGPYLQDVKSDEITVMWETESYPEGTVEYGLTDSYELSASGAAALSHCGRYIHEITLGGLSAGDFYYYLVESGGSRSTGSTFRTAPDAPADFSVVAYGDSRSASPGYFTRHSEVIRSIRGVTRRYFGNENDLPVSR